MPGEPPPPIAIDMRETITPLLSRMASGGRSPVLVLAYGLRNENGNKTRENDMTRFQSARMIVMVVMCMIGFQHQATAASVAEKVTLQVELIAYIDARSDGGEFRYFDPSTASMVSVFPANLHPKIISHDGFDILCADFRDAAGEKIQIDFIARIRGGKAEILQMVIGDRASIIQMIQR